MTSDAKRLEPGLHVCTSIVRTADGNLAGVGCDQSTYSSMKVLYAALVGRPPTVSREIRFYLNDSIVEKVDCGDEFLVVYSYPLDSRFVGDFRIEYIEQGCNYWKREFTMGTCPISITRPPIAVTRLVDLLNKFRM